MRDMIDVFFAKLSAATLKVESNTGVVLDFLSAALPWICMGLLLAIFFAQSARKKNKENYATEGMALGMCFGVAIGTSLGNNTGIGLSLGMLAGLVIGSCIEKKKSNDKE